MAGRCAWILLLFSLPLLAFLLLFSSADRADAISWKVIYAGDISDTTPGANADVMSYYTVATGHSNFSKVVTSTAPPEWFIAPDSEMPNGAKVGFIMSATTLSILNAKCNTSILVTIPFHDATTAETNTVDWVGGGENLTTDPEGNGLPEAIDKYPSYLNTMFNGLKPRARYYGWTNVISGAPPTQLNFVVFNPGQFAGAAGYPGFPMPEHQIGDAFGYANYVVLDNPVQPVTPSSITEFCTPLGTNTTLWGRSHGQGEVIAKVGPDAEFTALCMNYCADQLDNGLPGEPDGKVNDGCPPVGDVSEAALAPATYCPGLASCCDNNTDDDGDLWVNDGCPVVGNAEPNNVGSDDDMDTVADDGCIVVTDICSDQIDNDNDGKVDEDCYVVRAQNPAENTGIYGGNTHLFHAYSASYRDVDNDGIANNEDGCPYNADRPASPCGATSRECPSECTGAQIGVDDDGDGVADDGCGPGFPAPKEKDTNNNGVGDVCETPANCPGGDNDCDDDGFMNRQDICPLTADDQTDTDGDKCGDGVTLDVTDDDAAVEPGGADGYINDGCPLQGLCPESGAQCNAGDTTDDDGDTYVNDGCRMQGVISERCVTADNGPCNDAIGNACDTSPGTADGAFAKDMVMSPACIGGTDSDYDGWCDADETLMGSLSAGHECDDNPPVDDDADTVINDGCPAVGQPEAGAKCNNLLDEDADGFFNDGCTTFHMPENPSTPEYTGIDYKVMVGGVPVPLDPVPGVCSDREWYVSAGDVLGNGPEIDNDLDTKANAADTGAGLDCDATVGDTDQDGVCDAGVGDECAAGYDNCASDWNPEQLDTDKFEVPPVGDACDAEDDGDNVTDADEWQEGSDPKNLLSPRQVDLNQDGSISILDILVYGVGAMGKLNVRHPAPVCCCKVQAWVYEFNQNVGANANDLRVWFSDGVIIRYVKDSLGNEYVPDVPGAWDCKLTANKKLGCRLTGSLPFGESLEIKGMSCAKRQVVCWQWTLNSAALGGSWNHTKCTAIALP